MKATEHSGNQAPDENSKQKKDTGDTNPEPRKGTTLQDGLKIAGSALAGSVIGAGSLYAAEQQPQPDTPLDEPDVAAGKATPERSAMGKIEEVHTAKAPETIPETIIVVKTGEPAVEPVAEPVAEPTVEPAIENPAIDTAIEPATESPIKEPAMERPLDEQPIDEAVEAPATESIIENSSTEDSQPIDSNGQPDQPGTEEALPLTEETDETFEIEDDSADDWLPVNQEHPGIEVEVPPGTDIF
jgi:hypothetical protein